MGQKSNFDALIEDLGVSMSEGRIEANGEIRPAGLSIIKAFGQVIRAIVTLAGQVKGLRADLEVLKAGAAKPMQKALWSPGDTQISGDEFMAKALAAQATGRISGLQVATAEASINAGRPPPTEIIQAVLA